jgi:hypothetical protein
MMKEKNQYNQENITKLKSMSLIIHTTMNICNSYWISDTSQKRKQLFKSLIQHYYTHPELHQKKLFHKLALHCVERNYFDLVQYLVDSPYLDKNINIGITMNKHDLYSTDYTELKKDNDLTTCALLLSIGTKNHDMYHYIFDKIDLKNTIKKVSINSFAWNIFKHLDSVEFEKNYYLNHFIKALDKEGLHQELNSFIQCFKSFSENYDLTDCVEILKYERRVKNKPQKKIPKNYQQIEQFSDKMMSLIEKERLENSISNELEKQTRKSNKI